MPASIIPCFIAIIRLCFSAMLRKLSMIYSHLCVAKTVPRPDSITHCRRAYLSLIKEVIMTQATSTEFQNLKTRLKNTWEAGDFSKVAEHIEGVAREFV